MYEVTEYMSEGQAWERTRTVAECVVREDAAIIADHFTEVLGGQASKIGGAYRYEASRGRGPDTLPLD